MQEKILRFKNWRDAQASLVGKLLLKNLLDKQSPLVTLGDITCNEYGRPLLKNSDIDFNISHSGRYVVCAFGTGLKVGIDIEKIRKIDIRDFSQHFSSKEMHGVFSEEGQLQQFYNLWTMKESLVKAVGKGLSFPLKEVIIENSSAILDRQEWYLKRIDISEEYCCCLATNWKIEKTIEVDEVRIA